MDFRFYAGIVCVLVAVYLFFFSSEPTSVPPAIVLAVIGVVLITRGRRSQ